MGKLKIIYNTDNSPSSLQQEACEQSSCYFVDSRSFQLQYLSSYSLKFLHAGGVEYKKKKKDFKKGELLIFSGKQKSQACIDGQGAEVLAIFLKEEKINNQMSKKLIPIKLCLDSYLLSGNQIVQKEIINLCQELLLKLSGSYRVYYDISTIYEKFEEGFAQNYLNLHLSKIQKNIYVNSALLETVRRIAMAVDFIHSNFHRKIQLEDIARTACMSKYCFLRRFKEFFLMTPNEYLINYRLDKAAKLLKLKKMSISTIAMDCGFGSPQYFNYSFKRRFGYTPSMH